MGRRIRGLVTAVAIVAAGASASDAPEWTSLFDGKTLDGWSPQHTDQFHVRDGAIVIDGGTGWLRSARQYKDFELQAEYRATKPNADSGLLFRAGAESTPRPPHWPAKGYQLQVIDGRHHFMIFGNGIPPPRYERDADALKKVVKGPGQWQKIVLKVVGTHAEASLNGARITVSDAIQVPEGYIGLQGENGQFEWRDLKVRVLSAH